MAENLLIHKAKAPTYNDMSVLLGLAAVRKTTPRAEIPWTERSSRKKEIYRW